MVVRFTLTTDGVMVHSFLRCTYMKSSKAMSYDSDSLATGDIKWLGVRPSDLNR